MPPLKLDRDTQKVLDDGKTIHEFVKSEAWGIIKKKFIEKIRESDSISGALKNVARRLGTPNDKLLLELMAQGEAGQMCLAWLAEIEGAASQYKVNFELFTKTQEDSIMIHFPQRSEDDIYQNNG